MSLKRKKDGTYKIESGADLESAVDLIEEAKTVIEEIEAVMDEEYGYAENKENLKELESAVETFMAEKDVKNVFRDKYKLTLVRRSRTSWNGDKLKALLPKGMWLKVTRLVVDGDKIDDLVRKGELNSKVIDKALESKPEKPHVRLYPYKEGQDRDDAMNEEKRLMEAMKGEVKKKSGSKRKSAKS
jgi:hypothetical protein